MDLQGYMSGAIRRDERSFTCKGEMGPLYSGHPDVNDLQALREFAKTIVHE